MLKINLSDQDGSRKPDQEEISPETANDTAVIDTPVETSEQKKETPSRKKLLPVLVAALILVAAGVAVYLNLDMIKSLLPSSQKPVQEVQAPVTESEPVVEAVEPAEPELDPTFVLLDTISNVIPEHVWLTEVALGFDGTYTIRGMSFTHSAMSILDDGLNTIGAVVESYYPRKSDSAETIYRFTATGRVNDFVAPDILDMVPGETLAAYSAPIVEMSDDIGVTFTKIPESGKSYGDADTPFAVKGSFNGLKQVIGVFHDNNPDLRVYQLIIVPDAVGLPFDQVKASFSLRIQSSI